MSETTREKRHEQTRQEILLAALEIIREKGMEGLSLRGVARKVDYSPAGLYEYFGSKEEIIQAVCSEADSRLAAMLRSVDPNLPVDDYLVELGIAYIEFARRNPEHFKIAFLNGQLIDDDPDPVDLRQLGEAIDSEGSYAILLRAVQRGIEAGLIVSKDGFGLPEIAYSVWAVVHGMAVLQVTTFETDPAVFDAIDRHAIRSYLRGLA